MKARLAVLLLFFAGCTVVHAAPVIGSKTFTESVILGEVARLVAKQHGVDAVHKRQLGGTRILWRALKNGEIDVYPAYTGTLTLELLRDVAADADIATIRARLQALGIGITGPLGFNNTYAIGMLRQRAAKLGVDSISDLARHPGLEFAFSSEFMDREDGWPGLQRTYALPQTNVHGMHHALAYQALEAGAVDAIDLYSTDAEIPYYDLAVLADDKHYFPEYEAVFLYRLDLVDRAPGFVAGLKALAGSITADEMQAMNAAVKLEGRSDTAVAGAFLDLSNVRVERSRWSQLWRRTVEHLRLVGISLGLALLLAIPLGVLAARMRRLGQFVLAATGILQTVPSLAMFVFMIPLFGIGAAPAIAALFLYSLLPIVRNTHAGLVGIAPEMRESAAALGLPAGARLLRVELPLAMRSILAGIKISAVINVGTATLGALIGAGGYGQPILAGIRLDDIGLILEGAVPAAVLALLVQGVFESIEWLATPRGLRIVARE